MSLRSSIYEEKKKNHIREEALYIREGEEPRENIREKEEPREKKKKTRSEKRPFTSEKGKNPERKKKSKTERERRMRPEWVALKCRRGTVGRWIGFRSEWVTLWPGSRRT